MDNTTDKVKDVQALYDIGLKVREYNVDVAQIIFTSANLILNTIDGESTSNSACDCNSPKDVDTHDICNGECTTCTNDCSTPIKTETSVEVSNEIDEYTDIIRKELGLG